MAYSDDYEDNIFTYLVVFVSFLYGAGYGISPFIANFIL